MQYTSWVAGHLTGGLGNRLFQHAAACGLSEKWKLPLVFYLPDCAETNHGPFDNIFKLFPRVPKVETIVPFKRLPEAHGGVFTFEPFPQDPPDTFMTVDGWRQSPLYFPSYGIVPDFESAIPEERRMSLLKEYKLNELTKSQSWFIHVRLGDYKILPHHQIDLNSYYSKAIQHLPKGAHVLLFSDEIGSHGVTFCEYFQKLNIQVTPVNISDELEALFLMSQCWGGSIVANSTFSWWGAYFARLFTPQKDTYKAVYPTVWGRGLPVAKDIVPAWGIKVQNE